jgi:hypothetical protein
MRGHKQHGDLINLPLFLSWQGSMLFTSVLSKSLILNVKGGGLLKRTHTPEFLEQTDIKKID